MSASRTVFLEPGRPPILSINAPQATLDGLAYRLILESPTDLTPASVVEALIRQINEAPAGVRPRHLRPGCWYTLACGTPPMLGTIKRGQLTADDAQLLEALVAHKSVSYKAPWQCNRSTNCLRSDIGTR